MVNFEVLQPITKLKVRETFHFGKFFVTKHSRSTYALFDSTNNVRSRWGRMREILKDATYAIENQKLPPAEKEQWGLH